MLTRGAWRRPGQVILRDVCSSGLDLLVEAPAPDADHLRPVAPAADRARAAAILRARSRLLLRAVLLQYPALWRAQQRGRAPLHASVCTTAPAGPGAVLIAGPGGVGKSTLVDAELARGATATCDNLCVSDGRTDLGPGRAAAAAGQHGGGARGRRMPHGRREVPWPARAESPGCPTASS